jgi:hypothetical protein
MVMPLIFWIFLLLSMIGWGRAVADHLVKESEQKILWPLQAIWGLALTCCFGSFYLALIPGSPKVSWWIWIGAGTVKFLSVFFQDRFKRSSCVRHKFTLPHFSFQIIFAFLVLASAGLMYLKAMAVRSFSCYDDFLAYIPEVRMILDRGDFSSPFSLRRLAAYGGQSILQSFFVLPLKEYYLFGFEKAFMLLLGTAFLFEKMRRSSAKIAAASILCILFLWASHPSINIASTLSGTVMVFGLLATAKLYEACDSKVKWRYAVLLGVLACALSQLRANDFAGAVVFISLPAIYSLLVKKDATLILAPITLLIGILPGAWMLYRSSGTVFFPVFQGNYDPSYGTFDTPDNVELLQYFKLTFEAARTDVFLVVVSAAFLNLKNRLWLISGAITALVILGVLTFNLRAIHDYQSVYRYAYPFFSGVLYFIYADLLSSKLDWTWPKRPSEWAARASAGLSVLTLAVLVSDACFAVNQYYMIDRETVLSAVRQGVSDPFERLREKYLELQSVLPQEGKIALAVEHPFLFDFSKSKFTMLDVPGCASPGRGFKTNLRPQQTDEYLRLQGIHYLVFEDPDHCTCQYSRTMWNSYKSMSGNKDFHKYWSPHHLQFFEYLDWKRSHDLVMTRGQFTVVKIN